MRDAWLGLAFLTGAFATIAASGIDPRVVDGPAWLTSDPHAGAWEVRTTSGGIVQPTSAGVVLRTADCNPPCRAAVVLHTTLPDGAWRAMVHVDRSGSLERARLFAVDRRPDRSAAWYTGRNLREGEGTAAIDIPRARTARPIEIGVVAVGAGGSIEVGALDVVPTRASRPFLAWAVLAGAAWTALGLVAAIRIARGVRGGARWILIAIGACMVVAMLLPSADRTVPPILQKAVGHAGTFAVLAAIARSSGAAPLAILARLAAFAAATELLQLFRPDRSPSIVDVALDLLGACVGLVAFRLFRDARRAPPTSAASPP